MKDVKKFKSIIDVPIKIETGCDSDHVLTPVELQEQLEVARKGKAKVDSKYVGNAEGLNHLFEYDYDYSKFLDTMSYIIKKGNEQCR